MAKAASKLAVIIKGVDKVTRPVRDAGKALGYLSRKARSTNDRVRSSSKGTMTALGALAGVAALGRAAKGLYDIATAGDKIAKTADKLGIGIEALQEFHYAAQRSGMSVEEFNKSLEFMQRGAAEAARGSGTAKDAYKALGISVLDSSGKLKSSETLMNEVSDRLSRVKNASLRTALAVRIFGRSGTGMLNMLKDGSAGLAKLRKEAHEAGAVMSEKLARDSEVFQDLWLNITSVAKGLANMLSERLMPAVNKVMDATYKWWVANKGLVELKLDAALKGLGEILSGLGDGFSEVWQVVKEFAGGISGLMKELGILDGGLTDLKAVGKTLAYVLSGALVAGLVSATTAVASFTAALLLNPITWVVAAVAALAYGAIQLYENWDAVKAWWKKLWAGIGVEFDAAWQKIKAGLESVGAFLGGAWDRISQAAREPLNSLTAWLSGLWDRISQAAKEPLNSLTAWLSGLGGRISQAIQAPFTDLKAWWNGFWSDWGGVIEGAVSVTPFGLIITHFDKIKAAAEGVLKRLGGLWDQVSAAWSKGGLAEAAQALLDGLWAGLKSGVGRIWQWLIASFKDAIKEVPILGDVVAGAQKVGQFAGKMAGQVADVAGQAADIASSAWNGISSLWGGGDEAQKPATARIGEAVSTLGRARPGMEPVQTLAWGSGQAASQETKMNGLIKVQFDGAPPGTRIKQIQRTGDRGVDISTGLTYAYPR